jgi:hypothetical protein
MYPNALLLLQWMLQQFLNNAFGETLITILEKGCKWGILLKKFMKEN